MRPNSALARVGGIDGARGVAASMIVVFHAWQLSTDKDPSGISGWVMSRMWIGVPFFFALSGFLLYRPFARAAIHGTRRPDIRRYAKHRVARIVPAYWIAAIAAFA